MEVYHILFDFFLSLNLLHTCTSQATSSTSPKCMVTWQRYNDTNHRNGFKASFQPSELSCLDECIGTPGCLAVDVDKRRSETTHFFECWFHGNDADLDFRYHFQGVDTYVKKVTCPAGIVPGMPGAEQLWKQMGPTGPTGPPGQMGASGSSGAPGMIGSTGFTGFTGMPGSMGQTGDTGATGATGYTGGTGATGFSGPIGSTGFTGPKGSLGPPGDVGLGVYLKSNSCVPTFATLKNVRSPGPATTYLLPSVNQCVNRCLTLANCFVVEFTNNTNNCSIPADINNVNTKVAAPGTDQVVVTSRCGTKGQADYTGFINDPYRRAKNVPGETGATGISGSRGLTGITGQTGPTGSIGMHGSEGYTGATGWTGATGSTGVLGLFGRPGSKGDSGVQGPPGNNVYIKDQCEPTWVIIDDVTSPGYSPYHGATTVDECMDFCLATPSCVAVDFLVTVPPCRIIKNLGSLNDKIKTPGAIQLVLVERCSVAIGATNAAPLTRNNAPLRADGKTESPVDSNSDESHPSPKATNNPWTLTFLLTLVSILVTDGVCAVVISKWMKCSNKHSRRGSQGDQNLATAGFSGESWYERY